MGLKQTLLNAVGPRFSERGKITAVRVVSERFRLIDIGAEKIRALGPTHKAQVNAGQWNVRTYTPIPVPDRQGQMRVLAYLHDHGPGSHWARTVAAGDDCWFMGLKSALEAPPATRLLVGDETSFAAALNLQKQGYVEMKCLFEVTSLNESRRVVEQLGLKNTALVERKTDDGHWPMIVSQAVTAVGKTDHAVLTGNAQMISVVVRALRAKGISSSQVTTKAHWSRLKAGLD